MSIDHVDQANIETNTNALTHSLENPFMDLIGSSENQANKIFRNLDQFQNRGGNDHQQAVEEYRKVFEQYNKADTNNELPDLQLVDYDNDGDMDIQLVENGKVERTFTHR